MKKIGIILLAVLIVANAVFVIMLYTRNSNLDRRTNTELVGDSSAFESMSSDEIYEKLINPAEKPYATVFYGDFSVSSDDVIVVGGAPMHRITDENVNTIDACKKYFSEFFSNRYTDELVDIFTDDTEIKNGYLYKFPTGCGSNIYHAYDEYSILSSEKNKVKILRETYYIDEASFDAAEKYRSEEYAKTGKWCEGRDLPKEFLSTEVDEYTYNYIYEDGKWVFDNFEIGYM